MGALQKLSSKVRIFRYKRKIKGLIKRGLKVGKNVTIGPTAWIDHDYCFLISIGDNCTVSKGVRLIAHDATTFNFIDKHTRIGKILIKDNCYIGENVIILPGVTIGPNVLVASGSVVNKDIPPDSCVAGVPARFYAKFSDFVNKQKENIKESKVFNYPEIMEKYDENVRNDLLKAVENRDAYVRDYEGRFPWIWDGDNFNND